MSRATYIRLAHRIEQIVTISEVYRRNVSIASASLEAFCSSENSPMRGNADFEAVRVQEIACKYRLQMFEAEIDIGIM